MSEITKPVMLDETGKNILNALFGIQNAINSAKKGTIYGFHITSGEADPEDAVSYIADAVGMTPAKMNFSTGVFDYGSWADAFFMPRPCMLKYDGTVDYYLDPDDYTKKEDGSASDVADTSYGGNAMMEWGQRGVKIWLKCVPDNPATGVSVYIADYQADADFHAWSFINNQGVMVDHFYTPIYNGHSDGTRMRSLSGQQYTKTQTAVQERTLCRANGSDLWDTEVFCDAILINYLLVLMGKSLDSQTVFGEGLNTDGTEAINNGFRTGVHNAKGLFYGTSSGAAATYGNAVKVFGMENWWGFVWRRFGGLVNAKGTAKYKLTRGTQDGSSATDYVVSETEGDYSGYLTGASIPASISGTFINTQTYKDDGSYFPTAASGSATTYYCDGLWTNNTQVDYALRGGTSHDGSHVGAFCLILHYPASYATWLFAAAPSCKPRS